jgi:hypothetical protein
MSTPLDQLQNPEPNATLPSDEERVKRILAEMGTAPASPPQYQPQMPRVITEPPLTTSTGEVRMDPATARAHVIGNSIPSSSDFRDMFQQTHPGTAPFYDRSYTMTGNHEPNRTTKQPGWKSVVQSNMIPLLQVRNSVAVAILVFLLNMPVITSMMSRYASWMYLSSGEISIRGLLVKAVLAAILFTAYQGISAALT